MTLNADGTGSLQINGNGALLRPFIGSLTTSTLGNGNPGTPFTITWTYADGTLTSTLVGFDAALAFNVGPGGRLLLTTLPEFDQAASRADVSFMLLSRLK
jgi:hypothetical protein